MTRILDRLGHALSGDSARIWLAFAATAAAMLIILLALRADLMRPFFQVHDADVHYMYRAFRFNSDWLQRYFEHTGYLQVLFLSWWLKLSQLVGAIPATTIEGVRAHDPMLGAFAAGVYAARVYALLLGLGFVAAFYWASARISRNRVFAAMLAVVLAASGGIGYGVLTLRPEMLSAFALMIAFAAILLSGRVEARRAHVLLAVAAGFAYLSMLTKMQAIIPLLFLPALGLTCARRETEQIPAGRDSTLVAVLVLLLALLVFMPLALTHYFALRITQGEPVGSYVWLLIGYIAVAVAAHAVIQGKSLVYFLNSVSSILIGAGVAFFLNYFRFSYGNVGAMTRFLDTMKVYGKGLREHSFEEMSAYFVLLERIMGGVWSNLLIHFSLPDPWLIMVDAGYLGALGLAVYLFRHDRKAVALQILVLVATAFMTQSIFRLRGLPIYYEPYYLFMLLFGLCVGFAALQMPARSRVVAAVLPLIAVLATATSWQNHAQFISRPLHTPRQNVADFCSWQRIYAPVLPPALYQGETCWPHYMAAMAEGDPGFPLPRGATGGK